MADCEIELDNVSVKYPASDAFALKSINLKIGKGEAVAIVGESGCGKTSLMRTINGLSYSYYEAEVLGKVLYKGKDITTEEIGEIAQNIGTIFQNPRAQFFNLDTSAELIFGCENIGLPKDELGKRIEKAIGEFRLQGLINRDIFQLSGGEKQRLAIAEVLAMGPEVLLLDEVSSNLDLVEIGNLKEILMKLKAGGKTIIINEHRLYWLTDLVDRYVYMKDGKIEEIFTRDEFLKLPNHELHGRGLRDTRLDFEPKHGNGPRFNFVSSNFSSIRNKDFKIDVRDFDVMAGALGIIGRNGCGKSTFVEGLLGLIRNEGHMLLDSKPVSTSSCSYVMQDVTRQLFKESVIKEAMFYNDANMETVDKVLEFLNLEGKKERHPQSLSGGEKQRVAIANSILSGRKVCIMDEPTSGLDYRNMVGLSKLVAGLKDRGIFVIVITHDFELLGLCCDAVLEIKDRLGEIQAYEKASMEKRFFDWFGNGKEACE